MHAAPVRAASIFAALVAAPVAAAPTDFDFGTIRPGAQVVHEFVLRNEQGVPTRITGVELSPPLQLDRAPATIPVGGAVTLRVRLDTKGVRGDYNGRLVVALEGEADREFAVHGHVQPAVEVLPYPAIFIATTYGREKGASVEVVQHESSPVEISISKPPGEGEAKLEAIEAGRRYRLTVTLGADAAPGRRSTRLELATPDSGQAVLPVAVNLLVRERVHTFPDAVELGSVHLRDLRASGSTSLAQTLMVYQDAGHDFRVTPSSTPEGLDVRSERGPQGDRVELMISLDPRRASPGRIEGTLVLATNDPDFPRLEIPVHGRVLPD